MTTNSLALSRSGSRSGPATDHGAARDAGGATRPIAGDGVSAWYDGGERIPYDPARHTIGGGEHALRVFVRKEGDVSHAVSFLPGYPDGSIGWAKVLPHLPGASVMPKLFVDYVGMGDSDKPWDYAYSTAERTDLIEVIWRELNVKSTTLVAFDFSSLVVLEHLRRRLERAARGEAEGGPEIRGVFSFNGGLFTDGHSHPWFTTPVLRRLPERARKRLGRSFNLFKLVTRVMWSKRHDLTDAEVRTVLDALNRHDGAFYIGAAAGFVADHKAQGERLDFGRLFMAWRERFPFLVGGSEDDAFEHRQVDLAEQRLVRFGLAIARLPGGHLTTHEEPRALAELIARFERDSARGTA